MRVEAAALPLLFVSLVFVFVACEGCAPPSGMALVTLSIPCARRAVPSSEMAFAVRKSLPFTSRATVAAAMTYRPIEDIVPRAAASRLPTGGNFVYIVHQFTGGSHA